MPGPITFEQLITEITDRYDQFGPRSRDIARFVVQNPNDVALSAAKAIAERIGTEASSLVRFAQSLGYSGFAEMQRVFQSRLVSGQLGYAERVEALKRELGGANAETKAGLLKDIAIRDIAALHRLTDAIQERDLEVAAKLLATARTVHVIGQMRSLPVATYIHYLLVRLRRSVRLLSGAGEMPHEEANTIRLDDVLVAVSFRFYALDVATIVEKAAARGVPVIAITDSPLSPIAKHARATFIVTEAENLFSRSLAAPMCVAQALVVAMAHEIRPDVAIDDLTHESLKAAQ